MVFESMDEQQQSLHWIGRVPSSSNPADPLSRGTLAGIEFLRPFTIRDCHCPISSFPLKGIVQG